MAGRAACDSVSRSLPNPKPALHKAAVDDDGKGRGRGRAAVERQVIERLVVVTAWAPAQAKDWDLTGRREGKQSLVREDGRAQGSSCGGEWTAHKNN